MYTFIRTTLLEGIELFAKQEEVVLTEADTNIVLQREGIIGYYIYKGPQKIGFMLLLKKTEKDYFLWSYIIDKKFQNLGHGTNALKEFLKLLKDKFDVERVRLCYELGNNVAQHIYDKVGFCEVDRRDFEGEDGKEHHEINMSIYL